MSVRRLGFQASDLVTIGFGLAVAAIALANADRMPDPKVYARYLAVAVGYAAAIRILVRAGGGPMTLGVFRAAALCVAIPYMFLHMGDVLPHVVTRTYERELVAIDTSIFGVEPLAWMERLLNPIAVDVLQFAYALYFPMFLCGLLLLFGRQHTEFNAYATMVALVQCVSYLGYFLVPAMSPYRAAALPEFAGLFQFTKPVEGLFIQPWLGPAIHDAESCILDCFPSGHAAGALGVLLAMWKWRRKVFWAILPIQVCVILATVYLRYHYVVDVLAGLVIGVASLGIGIVLAKRMSESGQEVERTEGVTT